MEIHKPHAAKTWKEFFVELGTIVAGIVIALALEQLVETFHENAVAGTARSAIRAEVRENLWWLEQRERIEPCVGQRLAELDQLLIRARHGDLTPMVHNLGNLGHMKMTTLRWEANSQGGRASLFSEDEQRVLGEMYYTTGQFAETQGEEETNWHRLRFIQGLEQLTPLDVHDLGIFVAEARDLDGLERINIKRAHQWAERMRLTAENPEGVDNEITKQVDKLSICQPLTR